MGYATELRIEAWQKAAGIKPSQQVQTLRAISNKAFELIKVIELECSGIRDGDGYWHGGDVMGHMMRDMITLCQQYMEMGQPSSLRKADLKDVSHDDASGLFD